VCCVTQQHNPPICTDPGVEWQPVPCGSLIDGSLICVLNLLSSAQRSAQTCTSRSRTGSLLSSHIILTGIMMVVRLFCSKHPAVLVAHSLCYMSCARIRHPGSMQHDPVSPRVCLAETLEVAGLQPSRLKHNAHSMMWHAVQVAHSMMWHALQIAHSRMWHAVLSH
jgi:hypothetical protein